MSAALRFSALPLALATRKNAPEASFTCETGITIEHSNRTASQPCVGRDGDECPYACDAGYIALGRHVCQSYSTKTGEKVLDQTFFGGRCERLCSGSENACPSSTTPVRWNATDGNGACLETTCLSEDQALQRLGRGAYKTWLLGRSESTGMYSDSVNPSVDAKSQSSNAHIGINGVALMMECVAVEMGWSTVEESQQRVNLSLSSLASKTAGFTLARNARGWIPTFYNKDTGASTMTTYTVLDTGLNAAGVLFAKRYFSQKHPGGLTESIVQLADEIWDAVQWESLLCDGEGAINPNGTAIPFTFDDGNGCAGLHLPKADGYYEFSELHYTVWLAYNRACAGYAEGACPNAALERMWQAWQGRRLHPDLSYKGYDLLSLWSSYIVQLPYYAAHSFNSDDAWQRLFKSHWQADLAYYQSEALFAGDAGRYGLAAGFTDKWCSAKAGGYEADMLVETQADGAQGCRHYSPYAVAGYLPASHDTIRSHLLELLASGESVFPLPGGSGDFIMLRKSMLEPGWNQNDHVSMVDFSSELFGLSTLWLGETFWQTYTNHFGEDSSVVV